MQRFLYFALLLGIVESARLHKVQDALQAEAESVTKVVREWAIKTLSDIPSVEATAQGKLLYLEAGVNAGENVDMAKFDYYHSGIGLEFPNGKSFSIQWYATNGMFNAIAPGPGLKWDSATQTDVTDSIDPAYWTKRTHIADISGEAWNNYRKSLLAYATTNRTGYYQLWDVESPEGKVLLPDSTCDSFSEAAIWKLSEFGAKMLPGVQAKRNHVKVFAQETPNQVNMKDPTQVAELEQFWQEVAELKAKISSTLHPGTIQKATQNLKAFPHDLIAAQQRLASSKHHVFIGSPAIGWVRVTLVPPFSQSGYFEMRLPK